MASYDNMSVDELRERAKANQISGAWGLNFLYQEHKSDGSESNFFRLENPDREAA